MGGTAQAFHRVSRQYRDTGSAKDAAIEEHREKRSSEKSRSVIKGLVNDDLLHTSIASYRKILGSHRTMAAHGQTIQDYTWQGCCPTRDIFKLSGGIAVHHTQIDRIQKPPYPHK